MNGETISNELTEENVSVHCSEEDNIRNDIEKLAAFVYQLYRGGRGDKIKLDNKS